MPLDNPAGMAPGLFMQDRQNRMLFAVPGVPDEMKAIFSKHIRPAIARYGIRNRTVYRTLLTAGEPESGLAAKLADLTSQHRIAFLPKPGLVRLRLSATGNGAEMELDTLERQVRTRVGASVFGAAPDTLQGVVGRMLQARNYRVAVAESCTGGRVLDLLTNVPGASTYTQGGVVAYSNAVKQQLLGVTPDALKVHGAVSRAVAVGMASGVRARLRADVGLSVTGVAGPGGGTDEKPVGTVWIGYAVGGTVGARRFHLGNSRERNKEWSAVLAIDLVRRQLLEE